MNIQSNNQCNANSAEPMIGRKRPWSFDQENLFPVHPNFIASLQRSQTQSNGQIPPDLLPANSRDPALGLPPLAELSAAAANTLPPHVRRSYAVVRCPWGHGPMPKRFKDARTLLSKLHSQIISEVDLQLAGKMLELHTHLKETVDGLIDHIKDKPMSDQTDINYYKRKYKSKRTKLRRARAKLQATQESLNATRCKLETLQPSSPVSPPYYPYSPEPPSPISPPVSPLPWVCVSSRSLSLSSPSTPGARLPMERLRGGDDIQAHRPIKLEDDSSSRFGEVFGGHPGDDDIQP